MHFKKSRLSEIHHLKGLIMNKKQLSVAVADELDITREEAAKAVDAVIETIKKELIDGEQVRIKLFGKFNMVLRKAKIGRNPRTGIEVNIPAKMAPRFVASRGFIAETNK
jgi:DNA-binding protein HU-beta